MWSTFYLKFYLFIIIINHNCNGFVIVKMYFISLEGVIFFPVIFNVHVHQIMQFVSICAYIYIQIALFDITQQHVLHSCISLLVSLKHSTANLYVHTCIKKIRKIVSVRHYMVNSLDPLELCQHSGIKVDFCVCL